MKPEDEPGAFEAFYAGVDRWMVVERERAVDALARSINECSFGTVKWDSAPDGYQEMRRIGARVILAELNDQGWKLVR